MDLAERLDDERAGAEDAGVGTGEQMFDLGGDERRMHVRAYNFWVSLLKGRPHPAIADLDPAGVADFGANSVLLDFTADPDDPRIAYLGRSLRDECGLREGAHRMADVPSRSLLSRLTDHYLQIIANRAPIGFEAEFVGTRGHATLYRGILMPFSSNGEAIDFIYGVISWKELVDAATQAGLDAELDAARRLAPAPIAEQPVWADGPSAGSADAEPDPDPDPDHAEQGCATEPEPTGGLAERLMMARESAAAVRAADTRTRAALYRALGRAHDFAAATERDPDGYARLLAETGIKPQARAPMTPVAKLVFGADHDKTRLTEYAAVLTHARRHDVPAGRLVEYLSGVEGGVKAVVAAERRARRPDGPRAAPAPPGERPALATVAGLDGGGAAPGALIALLARVAEGGALEVVGMTGDRAAVERTARAIG